MSKEFTLDGVTYRRFSGTSRGLGADTPCKYCGKTTLFFAWIFDGGSGIRWGYCVDCKEKFVVAGCSMVTIP